MVAAYYGVNVNVLIGVLAWVTVIGGTVSVGAT
jgi:hypothetical protein